MSYVIVCSNLKFDKCKSRSLAIVWVTGDIRYIKIRKSGESALNFGPLAIVYRLDNR